MIQSLYHGARPPESAINIIFERRFFFREKQVYISLLKISSKKNINFLLYVQSLGHRVFDI